jgi:hypothetical protein
MSLEREVDEMINDMMKKEVWPRSQVLRTLKVNLRVRNEIKKLHTSTNF